MIEGVSSDLESRRIGTFNELYDYCYHVASVVGLTIIHIFGFNAPAARGGGNAPEARGGSSAPEAQGRFDPPEAQGGFNAPAAPELCHTPPALALAEKCGIAFQLTNILR